MSGSPALDVVAILNAQLAQVFAAARPMRALVRDTASFPKQPLESGATFSDNRIFNPVEIELSMILTPATVADTYAQMREAYQSSTPLSVQTRVRTYENMYIEGLPFDSTPEVFDTIAVSLRLREVQFVEAQYRAVTNARSLRNNSTAHTGQHTPQAATPAQNDNASVLYGLLH